MERSDENFGPREAEDAPVPAHTPAEQALETVAALSNIIPVLGGAIDNVLSGVSQDRKWQRVNEFLADLSGRVTALSEQSAAYVKTEDFEDLLQQTLRRVSDEKSEEKRRIYGRFLAGAVESPGEAYDEQLRILRTLEEMQPDHVRVLQAIMQPARTPPGMTGSGLETLSRRLPAMDPDRIKDLVQQLEGMRLVDRVPLNVTMTATGAEELHRTMTDFGRRFARYLAETD